MFRAFGLAIPASAETEAAREDPGSAWQDSGAGRHLDDDDIFEARAEQDAEDRYAPVAETPPVLYEYDE